MHGSGKCSPAISCPQSSCVTTSCPGPTGRSSTAGPSTRSRWCGGGRRPCAAGTALEFPFLAEALGADRPVAVIGPRGMHRPGPPDRTIGAAGAHVREEIGARLGPADPCVILGFSGSGPVAYEAAQQMHAEGRAVHLVLLDTAPLRRRP